MRVRGAKLNIEKKEGFQAKKIYLKGNSKNTKLNALKNS